MVYGMVRNSTVLYGTVRYGTVRYDIAQTLIHGDPKSANFFYRARGDGGVDVGVIDFQWTGAGLCATDVAYAMWACPTPGVLDHEQELVTTVSSPPQPLTPR